MRSLRRLCSTSIAVFLVTFCVAGRAIGVDGIATPENYVINVGDEIEMDILDDSDPPQRYVVGSDGAVQLPFIGSLTVASLRVSEAREAVRSTYVEREIFVNPGVELSIATFRPISVLGDVRTPGNYQYQPFLTAEQAVGMAGGPSVSANNEEARVLERRNLEGTLGELEFELALAAAQFARVQAQLKGQLELSWSDLEPEVRPYIDRTLFDEHKPGEDRVIAIEARDIELRRDLLAEAVAEAEKRIAFLDQREALKIEEIATAKAELERVTDLVGRGITPRSEVVNSERTLSSAEDELLQIREGRSAAIVQAANLKGELSRFDTDRERDLRLEAQQHRNTINKLTASRASIQDRMLLLQQWMNAASGLDTELLMEYRVRRRQDDAVKTSVISSFEEILPGDMLVVIVKPPEALKAASQ